MVNVPIRIIGTSGGGAPQNAQNPNQTGIVQSNPNQAEQRLQNAAQYRDDAARTSVDAIGTVMQTMSASIQARTNNDNRVAQALGGLGAVAQVVTEWSQKRQEYQLTQRAELEEQLSSEQQAEALDQAQTILDSSRGIITELGYEKGVEVVRDLFNQSLAAFPNLDPDALKQVRTTVFNELSNINGEMWRNQERELAAVNESRRSVVLYQGRIQAGQSISALRFRGSSATYEEKLNYMQTIMSDFTESEEFQGLSADTQLSAYAEFMEYVAGALVDNEEAVQMAQGELERTQSSQTMLRQAMIAYENGQIDKAQLDEFIQQTNIGNRTAVSPLSTFDQLENRIREGQIWSDFTEMEDEKLYAEAGPLADVELGNVVANILAGRASETSLPDDDYGDKVREVLANYREQYEGRYEPAQRKLAELGREQVNIQRQQEMARLYLTAYNNATPEQREAGIGMGAEFKRAFDNNNTNTQRLAEIRSEIQAGHDDLQIITAQLTPFGLQHGYRRQGEFYNSPDNVRRRQEAAEVQAERQAQGTTSFNYGTQAAQGPSPRPLATLRQARFGLAEGAAIPFAAGTGNMVVTSGWSGHAGGRPGHGGIDFAPLGGDPGNAQVAAVRTGRVRQAGWSDTWGNHVIIVDQDGNQAVYAHMTAAPGVKSGDVVSQGQSLGIMGTTGTSTAPHLHFSVMKPGCGSEGCGTLDPVAYINQSVTEPGAPVLGSGMPPHGTAQQGTGTPGRAAVPGRPFVSNTQIVVSDTTPPPGAFILPEANGWVYGDTMFFRTEADAERARSRRQASGESRATAGSPAVPASGASPFSSTGIGPTSNVFNRANPQSSPRVSGSKRDYGTNNPEHNFGYRALQDDRPFRLALHATASRLGIPAQWLADIIAFESGGTFSPSIRNRAGSGATGLIQFMPDTAQGLGTSTRALSGMTRTQQMRYVEAHFRPYANQINSITDAYMAVLYPVALGKGDNFTLFNRGTRAYGQNAGLDLNGDGRITAGEAARKIGPAGGRQYEFNQQASADEIIHERVASGCPSCAAFANAQASAFVPHMGIA